MAVVKVCVAVYLRLCFRICVYCLYYYESYERERFDYTSEAGGGGGRMILTCRDCNDFYIGKTKRRLHDRKTEHFKAHTSAIADHVKTTGHNIKWDHFDILASSKTDYHCKIKEILLIQELFQLVFKKPSLSGIDVKITPAIGFGLKFLLI